MTTREHIVTVVDGGYGGDAPLDIAQRAAAHGGRATLMVLLSDQDHRNIRALAASEEMALGAAEARYIEDTIAALTAQVGGEKTTAIVGVRSHEHRDLADMALGTDGATTVVIPQRIAGRRPWRNVLHHARIPVVVTPPHAA